MPTICCRIFISIFMPLIAYGVRTAGPREIIEILNNRTLYDKYLTPTQVTDSGPTQVTIGMYVEGMSSLRAQTMDFHMDIYFEQRWVDLRLRHTSLERVLVKDKNILNEMWHPDLYFANANSAKFFDVTAPNFLLWVFPDGTVHHDLRISLTVLCNMNFTNYPLDSQACDLKILSCKSECENLHAYLHVNGSVFQDAYTEEQLNITWRDKEPITKNEFLKLPDMEIDAVEHKYCTGEYAYGNWSCVSANLLLRRQRTHHFLQNYVPTILIVIISWFSFWLDVESVPGRVSLCITTLLTLATQASSARMALPQVSYAKAIDVWLEACLGFVFGVLIEFTIVNFLARSSKSTGGNHNANRHEMTTGELLMFEGRRSARAAVASMAAGGFLPQNQLQKPLFAKCDGVVNADERKRSQLRYPWRHDSCGYPYGVVGYRAYRKSKKYMAHQIDKSCRVAFPLAFCLFNVVYWVYYLR